MSNSCQKLCVFLIVIDSKQLFWSLPSSQLPFWWSSSAQTWDASLKNHSSPLLALQMEKNVFTERKKPSPLEINPMGNKNAQQLSTQCLPQSAFLLLFYEYCFVLWWNKPEGQKIEACDLFFIFSIVSHVSAVTQYVIVVPTLSVGLSGSGDSELGWINLAVKNIVPVIFQRNLMLLNFKSALWWFFF